jgi:fermentation-respiration switch protein FrsA (DUF1100 family)
MRSSTVALVLVLASACGSPHADNVAQPPDLAPSDAVAEEVTVTNAFGSLHGTLTLPPGCGPVPAVLIIAGSGPTDRNGNNSVGGLQTDTYRLLAERLSARGVAALRYDKAGAGASRGARPAAEAASRFEMGVADAALFLSRLRADPRVSRVVIAGHSEGALIGILAADSVPIDGYASLAGAGRPIGVILREQLGKQLDEPLLAESNAIVAQLEAGNTVAASAVPPELASLFRPSVQPYLISWMKYDPSQELANLDAPALIVQGTTDVQVAVVDAELLSEARADAELLLIDGMSHPLKAASLDTAEQQRAYTDPSLPVVPELIDGVAALANPQHSCRSTETASPSL